MERATSFTCGSSSRLASEKECGPAAPKSDGAMTLRAPLDPSGHFSTAVPQSGDEAEEHDG